MHPNTEAFTPPPPEKLQPQTQPQAKPEAQPLGTDAAKLRVSIDRRVVDAGNSSSSAKQEAEQQVYDEILQAERARIEALTEADPATIDAKNNGWSPEAERDAASDPDSRVAAKIFSEAGVRVNAARERHTITVWGKFAEQNPQTAQRFAEKNPDVRTAIDKYMAEKLAEARGFVERAYQKHKSWDPEYMAAQQTGEKNIGSVEAQVRTRLQENAFDELVEADPDATRFLLEYKGQQNIAELPQIKAAYERYLSRQEIRKQELAAEAARIAQEKGAEEGLRALAAEELKRKRSEAAKRGAATRNANREAAKKKAEQTNPGSTPGADTRPTQARLQYPNDIPISYDEGDVMSDYPAKTESGAAQPPDYARQITTYSNDLKALWPSLTPEEIASDPLLDEITQDYGGNVDAFISSRRAWHEGQGNPQNYSDQDISSRLKRIRDNAALSLGKERTIALLRKDRARRNIAPQEARPNLTVVSSEATTEAPKIPARERLPQAAILAGQLNLALEEARKGGRSPAEIQALETRAKEAILAYNAVLDEIITEGIVSNVSNESDPNKRKNLAQNLVRNEKDSKKRQALLQALITAGVLAIGTTFAGSSVARKVA